MIGIQMRLVGTKETLREKSRLFWLSNAREEGEQEEFLLFLRSIFCVESSVTSSQSFFDRFMFQSLNWCRLICDLLQTLEWLMIQTLLWSSISYETNILRNAFPLLSGLLTDHFSLPRKTVLTVMYWILNRFWYLFLNILITSSYHQS